MRKQIFVYWFYLVGVIVNLTFSPIVESTSVIAATEISKDKELLARKNRLRLQTPTGDSGDLNGGILLSETSVISSEPLVARFANRIDFQVQVCDSSVGTRDGDGIESVNFQIFDDETNELVHEKRDECRLLSVWWW